MDTFHFLRPQAFLLFIPCLIFLLCLMRFKTKGQQWQQWFDNDLIQPLLIGQQSTMHRWPLIGLCFVWLLSCFALAGPAWVKLKQPVIQASNAMVIVWDMSPSMMAADLKPNRLTRSRYKLTDLLKSRKEGQTALVVYGGEAHVVTPLSDDADTILSQLPALSPDLMPIRGSNTEMAIEKALKLLKESGNLEGDILLVTDGVVPEAMKTINQLIADSPELTIRLSVYAIGTTEGAPVPFAQGFAKDDQGNVIIDKLQTAPLKQLASQNAGQYVNLSRSNRDILRLSTLNQASLAQKANVDSAKTDTSEREFDAWKDAGVWLLWLILPLAALSFRRGWVFGLFIMLSLPHVNSNPTWASEADPEPVTHKQQPQSWWSQLWQTPNQYAHQQLKKGNYDTASSSFEDNNWKASANYRNGDYDKAAKQFDSNTAIGAYNIGNALAKNGDLAGAIEQYESALQKQPEFPQASDNLELVKKLLEQQEQQEQQDEKNSSSSNQDNQQSSESSSDNQEKGADSSNNSEQTSENSDQANSQGQNQEDQNPQNDSSGQTEQQSNEESSTDEPDSQSHSGGKSDEKEKDDAKKNPFSEVDNAQAEDESPTLPKDLKAPQNKGQQDAKEGEMEDENQPPTPLETKTQAQQEADAQLQQWLKHIPDDPSGLLKNKFEYQYRQRRQQYRRGEWDLPKNKANQRL